MSLPDLSKCIRVGAIGRPHGLKGAFFLSSAHAREPWQKHKSLYLKTKQGIIESKVISNYVSAGQIVLVLDCAIDRTQVESLVGTELFVERKAIKKQKGEYLVSELVGLKVLTEQGEHGVVKSMNDFGAQPNFEFELKPSGRTIYYPFLEHLIKRIDVDAGVLEVVFVPEFFDE